MKLKPAALEGLAAMAQEATEKGERITVKVPRGALPGHRVVVVLSERGLTAEPLPEAPAIALSAAEAEALDAADFPEDEPGRLDALTLSGLEYQELLERSLTVAQAARRLDLTPGRLRQRLAARTLFGIKEGAGWRIPPFQFSRGRIIRGLDEVLPAIREDAHPLAVQSWLASPHSDLLDERERPVAPLAWLAAGREVERVVELAAEV